MNNISKYSKEKYTVNSLYKPPNPLKERHSTEWFSQKKKFDMQQLNQ